MNMISRTVAAVICSMLVIMAPAAAAADRGRSVRPARPIHPVRPWHGDIHHFRDHDLSTCPEGWQKVPATPPDTGKR